MDLPEEAKRAPSAPVWNQSFPSPRQICPKRLSELHLPRFEIRVFLLLVYSLIFCKWQIIRLWDHKHSTVLYTTFTSKIIINVVRSYLRTVNPRYIQAAYNFFQTWETESSANDEQTASGALPLSGVSTLSMSSIFSATRSFSSCTYVHIQ